jgi:hypothetical protein
MKYTWYGYETPSSAMKRGLRKKRKIEEMNQFWL